MGRPDMGPQRFAPLVPPVFADHHDAPPMAQIVQVQPMHLHGKGVIRAPLFLAAQADEAAGPWSPEMGNR